MDMEMICFKIISAVGTARANYIEAMQKARKGNFEEAEKLINEGNDYFIEGHKVHAQLITNEASGNKTEVSLLLLHAEDQLMSAETIKIMVEELIEFYHQLHK